MIPNNFINIYAFNLEGKILDKILYEVDGSDIPQQLLRQVLPPFL
jgi:hypothetical protein